MEIPNVWHEKDDNLKVYVNPCASVGIGVQGGGGGLGAVQLLPPPPPRRIFQNELLSGQKSQ